MEGDSENVAKIAVENENEFVLYMAKDSAEGRFRKMIDVNTPIILIQDYDFVRVDDFIMRAVGFKEDDRENSARKVQEKIKEWNAGTGKTPFVTKAVDECVSMPLAEFLREEYGREGEVDTDDMRKTEPLKERYLVLKEIQSVFGEQGSEEARTLLLLMAQRRLYDETFNTTVIIVCSTAVRVPEELSKYVSFFEFDMPNEDEIRELIKEHIIVNKFDENKFTEKDERELMPQLKGMTRFEIDRMLDMAMSVGGTLTGKDGEMIFKQKKAMVKQAGILQLVDSKIDMDDIGGLAALKEYLKRKSKVVNEFAKAEQYGVAMPKGVFIVGMPGCGKSLCAKATAALFKVPLLKLDMGSMMGKYVGESEGNLRKAIAIAEAAAPCVLWIDEIEKAFSGVGGEGSDVLTRMFGYFLGWMQDKESAVYVVGTANNAEKLPPELKRKGRFDEIFCVNLPTEEERRDIFKVHLGRLRGKKCAEGVNIDELAQALASDRLTKGFNGADIEAVVNDAVEAAFVGSDGGKKLERGEMEKIAGETISITKSCKKQIEDMEKIFKENNFKDANTGKVTNR